MTFPVTRPLSAGTVSEPVRARLACTQTMNASPTGGEMKDVKQLVDGAVIVGVGCPVSRGCCKIGTAPWTG